MEISNYYVCPLTPFKSLTKGSLSTLPIWKASAFRKRFTFWGSHRDTKLCLGFYKDYSRCEELIFFVDYVTWILRPEAWLRPIRRCAISTDKLVTYHSRASTPLLISYSKLTHGNKCKVFRIAREHTIQVEMTKLSTGRSPEEVKDVRYVELSDYKYLFHWAQRSHFWGFYSS